MKFILICIALLFTNSANAQDDMNRFPGWHKGWIGGAQTAHRKGHTARFLSDAAKAATAPIRRMGEAVIGARPSGCPARAWCGCWLARDTGLNRRDLWLARNWARVGSHVNGPQVGAVVVWRHHVGRITAIEAGKVKVLSGNDGGRVRERWRSVSGAIAFRRI